METLVISAEIAQQMAEMERRADESFVDFFARVLDALDDKGPDVAGVMPA